MNVVAYVRHNDSRTNDRVKHFGNALGARFSTREEPVKCDLAIQAGFQITPAMQDAMSRGIPFIILENPVWHYGDKMETYTWGYNGLNGLGMAPSVQDKPSRPHPDLQQWKDYRSGHYTIFGQMENDKSLRGADIYEWADWMGTRYPQAAFREHPKMLSAEDEYSQEDFAACMARTSLAITFNSTVGAECVIHGIPTICYHPGSWAWEVQGTEHPCRETWIKKLSWRHWSLNEAIDVDYILGGYKNARIQSKQGNYDNMSNGNAQ